MTVLDWSSSRYVVVPPHLVESTTSQVILLTDVSYWATHADELLEWCSEHKCSHNGMSVNIDDPETMTLFTLRWA